LFLLFANVKKRIIRLWSGCITGLDDAYQLILIVDYILDWARDIYRPNILRQLGKLSTQDSDDTVTLRNDSDVYSLQGDFPRWRQSQRERSIALTSIETRTVIVEDIQAGPVADENSSKILSSFDGTFGLVRDAQVIESRVRALYITKDNVSTLCQGFDHQSLSIAFAQSVLAALKLRCNTLEGESVLNAIEDKWTGKFRFSKPFQNNESPVYAQFRISYFINHEWDQVRELTYLALSEDARQYLMKHIGVQQKNEDFAPLNCSQKALVDAVDEVLHRDVRSDFLLALSGKTFAIYRKIVPVITSTAESTFLEVKEERMFKRLDIDEDGPGFKMHQIVHNIYNDYRHGRREPDETFLRLSSRVDSQGRPLWKDWEAGDNFKGPDSTGLGWNQILVHGRVPDFNRPIPKGRPDYCLFVLDGQVAGFNAGFIVQKLFRFLNVDCIYGTVRHLESTRKGRMRRDRQTRYYFSMRDSIRPFGVPRDALRAHITDWITIVGYLYGLYDF
jgi:hypothetical protein